MKTVHLLYLLLGFSSAVMADNQITANSAAHQTAIVELYTSEGCSSCPPAERWLNKMVETSSELNVLPLAFHVDYWDYIGWKDRFASPQYTQRQRTLARQNRMNTMYTPGFFVNGKEARGTGNILKQIRDITQRVAPIDLMIQIQRGEMGLELMLDLQSDDGSSNTPHFVQFIVYEDQLSSDVQRGENAGRQLQHQHVVRYLSPPYRLDQSIRHQIIEQDDWAPSQLGIAAWVTTSSGDFIQAIQTPISDLYTES